MTKLARFAVVGAALAILPHPRSFAQSGAGRAMLSSTDRQIALSASRIGASSPSRALTWLRRRSGVEGAVVGRDGVTLDVRFRDGAELVMVPRTPRNTTLRVQPGQLRVLSRAHDTTPGRAIVLEPFADQLGLGPNAGATEIDSLKAAGFSVDVLRNTDVEIAAMTKLASYSVVYMETHSGTLGDGDAIVLTRQTSTSGLADLFHDGSVTQGLAYGDQSLYIAFKAQFVLKHMGTFPNSSILYLNGCEVLKANVLWDAFHQQHVATMISWDNKVLNTLDEQAADFMFPRLMRGETVADNVQAATANNLGSSTFQDAVAHLGFVGDGANTFDRALHGTLPPTPTPTALPAATATVTATPSPPPVSLTFDRLQTFAAGSRPSKLFRASDHVLVKARYTVQNATGAATIRISRAYAYRRGGAWHRIGKLLNRTVYGVNGVHVYQFTLVPKSAYHTQRVVIVMSMAGQTSSRSVTFTVQR